MSWLRSEEPDTASEPNIMHFQPYARFLWQTQQEPVPALLTEYAKDEYCRRPLRRVML
jgi:hypothetical protein